MNKLSILATTLVLATGISYADNHQKNEQSVREKIEKTAIKAKDTTEEAYEDSTKTVKKVYRNAKEKTCELINGKMECFAQKVGNKAKNLKDEAMDKANDIHQE